MRPRRCANRSARAPPSQPVSSSGVQRTCRAAGLSPSALRPHGHVGDVEHRGPAVALVREEETAAGGGAALGSARRELDGQRDAGERRVCARRGGQRRERGVRRVEGVAQAARIDSPMPSLPVLRHRQPAGGDDDRLGLQRRRPFAQTRQRPATGSSPVTAAPSSSSTPRRRGQGQETVAHVASAVRRGEQLARLRLLHQGDRQLGLEETRSAPRAARSAACCAACWARSPSRSGTRRAEAGRTLQPPPPLIRILRPPSGVRSRRRVSASPEAAKMAAIDPAAPAPITATRRLATARRYPRLDRLTCAPFAPTVPRQGRWACPRWPAGSRGGSLGLIFY